MCVDRPHENLVGSSLPQPFPKGHCGAQKSPKGQDWREGLSSGLTAKWVLLDADHGLVVS